MKKADKQSVVININGDNNRVSFDRKRSRLPVIAITVMAVAVLATLLCCPDLLADVVRWIISTVINS